MRITRHVTILTLLLTATLSFNFAGASLQREFSIQSFGKILDQGIYGTRGLNWELYHTPEGHTARQFQYMKNWGFDVVRFTFIEKNNVYPIDVNGNNLGFQVIRDAVDWAEQYNLDIILNYYDITTQSSGFSYVSDVSNWISNWQYIASQFKGKSHVIYEPMNEPWSHSGTEALTMSRWQSDMQSVVNAIRAIDPDTPIIIDCMYNAVSGAPIIPYGSFRSAVEYPISGTNIWYSVNYYSHIWEMQTIKYSLNYSNYADFKWYMDTYGYWDDAYNRGYKMYVGEFANRADEVSKYGFKFSEHMFTLMETYNIGWNAWWWSVYRAETTGLISDWNGTPTEWGAYVKNNIT